MGGFRPMRASGEVATGTVVRSTAGINQGGIIYQYRVSIDSGGSGYTKPPTVSFIGGPPDLAAVAEIDPMTGTVIGVTITNSGTDNNTPYDPTVQFVGGVNFEEIILNAFVEDLDGYISEVRFYENGTLIQQDEWKNPDKTAPYQIKWSPSQPGIYELYATAKDSDGNLFTSPIIRREAKLTIPPTIEFNPSDRAYGFVRPESIDENGSIIPIDFSSGLLPASTLVNKGSSYHSFPQVEFISSNLKGSGARGEVILENGKIVAIKMSKDSSGQYFKGNNYSAYKKLSGTIELKQGMDLLVGKSTDFMNEILIGQPLLLGSLDKDSPDLSLGEYKVVGFQSQKEILLKSPVYLPSGEYKLYTFGTEVVIRGGMNTAASPINIKKGNQLTLGLRAIDPDGKSINPDDFIAVLNGERISMKEDSSVLEIQGGGPFYRVVWRPNEVGDYNLRIQVTDADGGKGNSQTLAVSVAAGFEPSIKMVSPINEDIDYEEGEVRDTFAFPSITVFTFEAKDFDGRISKVDFFANSSLIGSWPDNDSFDSNQSQTWREVRPIDIQFLGEHFTLVILQLLRQQRMIRIRSTLLRWLMFLLLLHTRMDPYPHQ